jgi:3'(2'), 5'-bisphosphate nucleotidase
MQNIELFLGAARLACLKAGEKILSVYQSNNFDVQAKGDNSPLTLADKLAHEAIVEVLNQYEFPILSEEGKSIPFNERSNWQYLWMVDPLDGTKEFIKRNGEFTVNIALIQNGSPILGVVYAPVLNTMYWGGKNVGAWKQIGNEVPCQIEVDKNAIVKTIVASRSHLSVETQELIEKFPDSEVISMGSSLKFMLVAEGRAQLYPRFGPTMEWDTAAAQGVVEAAGGMVEAYPQGGPLKYNKENLLNSWFVVKG